MRLSSFRVLTFDCYGTLIDWESGITAALGPLLTAADVPAQPALEAFARHESAQEAETPRMLYSDVLANVHRRLAAEFGVTLPEEAHHRFGASVPDWPVFPDTPDALRYLKQHYQLVILSNVHREGFAGSLPRLGVAFDAVYTAQDIGSYKPDPANIRTMLAHLAERGIQPSDVLHTAQSLFHDHVPAQHAGLKTAWIDRQSGRPGATSPAPGARYDVRFTSMAAMADAHRAEASTA